MNYSITTEDKKISFSRWLESSIKIQILNDDETVIDELTSIINPGTIVKDGTSYVRYTYSLVNTYEVEKDGTVAIYRDYSKKVLTLITCTKNSDTKQTVFIFELEE